MSRRKGHAIVGTAMDERIFNTHALAVEILGRARRLVEFQRISMERVPASQDLVYLLITDLCAAFTQSVQVRP
jgi:hypothetical protein